MRAAFNLTGDEYAAIVKALSYNANSKLTLSNISAIFRRGWLARALKISVAELLSLIEVSGVDPFTLTDLTDPAPLAFIELVQSMKRKSLKPGHALYLIWNQDLSGRSALTPSAIALAARTLRLGLGTIEAEFQVTDDPTGSATQAQLAKVYGSDTANFFFGLLNDTLITEVSFSDPDEIFGTGPSSALSAIETAAGRTVSDDSRLRYDDFRKHLLFYGVLSTTVRDDIKAAGAASSEFATAMDALFDTNCSVIDPFFTTYAELKTAYDNYANDTKNTAAEKRATLLNDLLLVLIQRRKRQLALRTVTDITVMDASFAQSLLDATETPLPLTAAKNTSAPALNDLLALETTPGLTVRYFPSDTAQGTPIPVKKDITANVDYKPPVNGNGNQLPANPNNSAAAISAVWDGYLQAPVSGFFNFIVDTEADASVTLKLADNTIALIPHDGNWKNSEPIELRAGELYAIELTVEKVHDRVRFSWEWEGHGRVTIPAANLYPQTIYQAFRQVYARFVKSCALARQLAMTANELAFLSTSRDYLINGAGWLNALAVDGNPSSPLAHALRKPFVALHDYARIKAELSPNDESLLAILQDPQSATQGEHALLYALTRWEPASLDQLLQHFTSSRAVSALQHFALFQRIYAAHAYLGKMGIPAKVLIGITTNDPNVTTVPGLQVALRARYDTESWRDAIKPINDELRGLRRDALVAYILHRMKITPETAHINSAEKLFEYFLMDVKMEPCMQTSRIRHALSSVQLFIERCLMNLEPRVASAAIDAEQWEWEKRYRVWEAFRKIYLFPENWLEPELRDEQSPIFKQVMHELLQGDITEDRAATAQSKYLTMLADVAKLEPCGLYCDAKRDIDHVIARSSGGNRKYHYRRREGNNWTPWERINLEIEDNPVIPVVWNDRTFLFWLRIIKKSKMNTTPPITGSDPPEQVYAVLCWSEYVDGKWQETRTSDLEQKALIKQGAVPDK